MAANCATTTQLTWGGSRANSGRHKKSEKLSEKCTRIYIYKEDHKLWKKLKKALDKTSDPEFARHLLLLADRSGT